MNNVLIDDMHMVDEGFLLTCDATTKTLGSEGRLALLENLQHNLPGTQTKDGHTVSQRIRFKNKFNNFGCLQALIATARCLLLSGDNTTTCLSFAQGFIRGIKRKDFNKAVERGIEIGVEEVKQQLKYLAQPVDDKILKKIAITSCNGDEELGGQIIEAYKHVGYDSLIEVKQDFVSEETKVIPKNGYKINKGFSNFGFINNQNNAKWEGRNVLVLALETYQSDDNIMNFIRANRKDNDGNLRPILFYVEKENGDFKSAILDLIEAQHLDACMVIAENGHQEEMCITGIRDLALFTGGTSYHPKHTEIKAGIADYIVVDNETTYIVKSEVSEQVLEKIEELKAKEKTDDFTKQRIQKLGGKSVLISVGGKSQNDVLERADRLDDGLRAVKTAIPQGAVAGGGSCMVYISAKMKKKFSNQSEQTGYDLVKTVIQQPALQILKNANRKEAVKWYHTFFGAKEYLKHSRKKYGIGYNAKTDEVEDLWESGIIDSAKSLTVALESAKEASVKLLLTSVVVTIPE